MDKSKWLQLSKAQQLGNIGSEIARAHYWEKHHDFLNREKALERALELLDLTLDDKRWQAGLKEIARFREVVSAWFCNQTVFDISAKELEDYCIHLAVGRF
jgi:hypothetical protein